MTNNKYKNHHSRSSHHFILKVIDLKVSLRSKVSVFDQKSRVLALGHMQLWEDLHSLLVVTEK